MRDSTVLGRNNCGELGPLIMNLLIREHGVPGGAQYYAFNFTFITCFDKQTTRTLFCGQQSLQSVCQN